MARLRAYAAGRRRLRQQDGTNIQPIAVLLALKARRRCKLVLSREEDFEIGARAPPVHDLDEDRCPARRHAPRPRDRAAARRRRLRRRKPRVLGFALLMSLRPVPDPARARARPGGLHQQAARRRVPRLRQSPGELRRRAADRRARAQAGHRSRSSLRRRNTLAPGDPCVRRPADRARTSWPSASTSSSASRAGARTPPALDAAPGSRRRGLGVAADRRTSAACSRTGAIVRMLADGSVAAQHRRGRHRPGLRHGAGADLRRGAAGCRSSA